jgi:nucleoside-diphosphate-sugar epimerase
VTHHAPAAAPLIVGVTGASGFIGARLVERLADGRAPRPRPLTRGLDLRDPRAVRAAIDGCRAVAHCAFDFADLDVNLEIADVLGRACAATGARLVQVSTAAVHEPFPDGMLDENSDGGDGPGSDYKQVKRAIEDALLRLIPELGLDLVILRPTIVYGPHGRAWTDSPIRELLTGTVVLPEHGLGLCNAVHVDDVCQAVIAAVTARVPSGERFLVSGARPVAWKAFYGAYQAMLGLDAIALAPADPVAPAVAMATGSAGARGVIRRVATRLLGRRGLSRLNLLLGCARALVLGPRRHVASGPKLALFQARCQVRIDKARHLLGYEPRLDLTEGMRLTEPYVRATYRRLARLRRLRA